MIPQNPEVIRESARVGAHIINDIRSLSEPGALEAAAETGLPVSLMHMQGDPKNDAGRPEISGCLCRSEPVFC
ncbi:Dihydropteroate synthase [Kluyvera cryocrescens]|uniref:Dihydropteroate synthase n=1 Tax=Kluyvera cryocrescens TaxID=580 RepID=A0A485AL56_KLUCR|nr:Dihydropteroate synthase [Kluyvera cryocrescens]